MWAERGLFLCACGRPLPNCSAEPYFSAAFLSWWQVETIFDSPMGRPHTTKIRQGYFGNESEKTMLLKTVVFKRTIRNFKIF
jgi:hypothetical protein